jgi:anthranilate synthase component 1
VVVSRLKLPSGSVDMSISQYDHNLALYKFSYEQFKDAILKVKEHIFAGDIFQMVLSQCFERCTLLVLSKSIELFES